MDLVFLYFDSLVFHSFSLSFKLAKKHKIKLSLLLRFAPAKYGTVSTATNVHRLNPVHKYRYWFLKIDDSNERCAIPIFIYRKYFTEREAALIVRDVASALEFLHSKGQYTVHIIFQDI